jgi:hypothetical protein
MGELLRRRNAQPSSAQEKRVNVTLRRKTHNHRRRREFGERSTRNVGVQFRRDGGDAPRLEGLARGLGIERPLPHDFAPRIHEGWDGRRPFAVVRGDVDHVEREAVAMDDGEEEPGRRGAAVASLATIERPSRAALHTPGWPARLKARCGQGRNSAALREEGNLGGRGGPTLSGFIGTEDGFPGTHIASGAGLGPAPQTPQPRIGKRWH